MDFNNKKYQGFFHLGSILLIPVFIIFIGLTDNYLFIIPLVFIVGYVFFKLFQKKK